MAKYKIITPINWGPYTIGDKNYGPQCPSCVVSINNYAPKVGEEIEGTLETRQYYAHDYTTKKKVLKTGTGIFFPIRTNGSASTQSQTSDQFITVDHLEEVKEPVTPTNPPVQPSNENEDLNTGVNKCWICDNKWIILLAVILIVILIMTSING